MAEADSGKFHSHHSEKGPQNSIQTKTILTSPLTEQPMLICPSHTTITPQEWHKYTTPGDVILALESATGHYLALGGQAHYLVLEAVSPLDLSANKDWQIQILLDKQKHVTSIYQTYTNPAISLWQTHSILAPILPEFIQTPIQLTGRWFTMEIGSDTIFVTGRGQKDLDHKINFMTEKFPNTTHSYTSPTREPKPKLTAILTIPNFTDQVDQMYRNQQPR